MAKSTRRELMKTAGALGLGAVSAENSRLFAIKASYEAAQARGSVDFFPGFKQDKAATSGAVIHYVVGGSGPGLLLLHGSPQSRIIWRKVAPQLSEKFTVVAADLRGYGDSTKPPDGQNHSGYSKRAMAQDQVELMGSLGFKKFAVVGHDRGGRVAHRMALDHADAVEKVAVLDIVPTYKYLHNVTKELATISFHWFFLIQAAPFPETLIGGDIEYYLKFMMLDRAFVPGSIDEAAFAEYVRCYRSPGAIHANCEDYRAGASIDLEHDEADLSRKVSCPLLALWGEHGSTHRLFDVLETWKERASNVNGKPLPCGHYIPEEAPQALVNELKNFLA